MEEQIREIARQEAQKLIEEKFASLQSRPSEYISTREAREEYDLFGATLYRRINEGHLTLIKRGGKSFLKRSQVEKLFVPKVHAR